MNSPSSFRLKIAVGADGDSPLQEKDIYRMTEVSAECMEFHELEWYRAELT